MWQTSYRSFDDEIIQRTVIPSHLFGGGIIVCFIRTPENRSVWLPHLYINQRIATSFTHITLFPSRQPSNVLSVPPSITTAKCSIRLPLYDIVIRRNTKASNENRPPDILDGGRTWRDVKQNIHSFIHSSECAVTHTIAWVTALSHAVRTNVLGLLNLAIISRKKKCRYKCMPTPFKRHYSANNTLITLHQDKIYLNAFCALTIHGGCSFLSLRGHVISLVQMGTVCQHLQQDTYAVTHTRQLLSPSNTTQLTLNGLYVVTPTAGGWKFAVNTPYGALRCRFSTATLTPVTRFRTTFICSERIKQETNPLQRSKTPTFPSSNYSITEKPNAPISSIYIVIARPNVSAFFHRLKNAVCWRVIRF
jgi:hypothetical protein